MGDQVGVHEDQDVANLSPDDLALLKRAILLELVTDEDIRAIIEQDMKILTSTTAIKNIVKTKVEPLLKRLSSQ